MKNNNKLTWSCLPGEKTENEYAIFFSISDSYSAGAANMVMGLYQHSAELMRKTDIIIYHDGISENNIQLLKQLHENTHFVEMTFPESWDELLRHKKTIKWGSFVLCKFFGFELIKEYDKVLHLDADMLIRGDISDLFKIDEEMAWRKILAWNPDVVFADLLDPSFNHICTPNGGLLYFTDKLRKYAIDSYDIVESFEKVKDLECLGGIDELILAWLVYSKKITLKELNVNVYNTAPKNLKPETKIVHFVNYKTVQTKPWKSLAAYLYFKDWVENYQRWLALGGEGLVNFTDEDYYKLFAFDKEQQLHSLKAKSKKVDGLQSEVKRLNKRIAELEKKYDAIRSSKSWKLTKPLRWIANKARNLIKKVRKCFKK